MSRRLVPAGKGLRCDNCGAFPHAMVIFINEAELMLCKEHLDEGAAAIEERDGEVIELGLADVIPFPKPRETPTDIPVEGEAA